MASLFKKKEEKYLSEKDAAKLYQLKQALKTVVRPEIRTANSVLKQFWAESNTEDRLLLLQKMSEVVIKVVSYEQLTKKRRNFDGIKNTRFTIVRGSKCWACNLGDATIRHHVILLKNGGPVTAKTNIVRLCTDCHRRIHPWLNPDSISLGVQTLAFMNAFLGVFEAIMAKKLDQKEAEKEALLIISSLFT